MKPPRGGLQMKRLLTGEHTKIKCDDTRLDKPQQNTKSIYISPRSTGLLCKGASWKVQLIPNKTLKHFDDARRTFSQHSRTIQSIDQRLIRFLTIYGLSPTHSASSQRTSKGFQRPEQLWSYNHTTASSRRTSAGFDISIYGLNRHYSKLPEDSCRIFTTRVVMVLQPHNSKLTKNSCRICNKRFLKQPIKL